MYLPTASGIVRLGLRIYFIIVLLFIAFVGDRCCHLRTKLMLLRGQNVSVTAMTGWVRGIISFKIVARLRRLPGGWLGALMLLTAVLALVTDLTVARFVVDIPLPTRCPFHIGLVLNTSTAHYYPSIYGAAYRWASTAQLFSIYNGGYMGIYKKLDNNTYFLADESDVVGYWLCNPDGGPKTYSNSIYDAEIWEDMRKQGLLYQYGWSSNISDVEDSGQIYGRAWKTIIVTSSSENHRDQWDVRAAIDLSDTDQNTKIMQAYHCVVSSTDDSGLVEGVISNISIIPTLETWLYGIQGEMYNGQDKSQAVEFPNVTIAWMLNSMVMVSGGGESVTTPQEGTTEGCFIYGTYVGKIVSALFLLVAFIAVSLFFYTVFLWRTVRRTCNAYDLNNMNGNKISSREICQNAPNGLLDWIGHAAHESGHAETKPKAHHLRKWLFSTRHHYGRRMGVVHMRQTNIAAAETPSTSSAPFMQSPMSEASTLGFRTEYMGSPEQKTTYPFTTTYQAQ